MSNFNSNSNDLLRTAASLMGSKGGRSKTRRKVAAARANIKIARTFMTSEERAAVGRANCERRWGVLVFAYVAGGLELWGDLPLPDGAEVVGVVERNRKIGALLRLPGGGWGLGFRGEVSPLPSGRVLAALAAAQKD